MIDRWETFYIIFILYILTGDCIKNEIITVTTVTIVFILIFTAIIPATTISTKIAFDNDVEYWGVVVDVFIIEQDPHPAYLYESLLSANNWNSSHMLYLHQENTTKEAILDSIDWLASKSDGNDMVLFAFTGHGNIDIIEPFNITSIEEAITADELKEKLDEIDCKGMCVILDSCQSGIFGNKIKGENRIVLKSTFRKGLGITGFCGNKWMDFSNFIGEAITKQ